jgi:hypothetical protein
MSAPDEEKKIIIDEDWKSQVQAEREAVAKADSGEAAGRQAESPATDSGDADETLPPLPPPSFAELVTMLATQASVSLSQGADPNDKQRKEHLSFAKHFIDLLAVVEEKTTGNLSADEAQMLDNLLHELRMAYVQLNR